MKVHHFLPQLSRLQKEERDVHGGRFVDEGKSLPDDTCATLVGRLRILCNKIHFEDSSLLRLPMKASDHAISQELLPKTTHSLLTTVLLVVCELKDCAGRWKVFPNSRVIENF
jgi:hypothetical protein